MITNPHSVIHFSTGFPHTVEKMWITRRQMVDYYGFAVEEYRSEADLTGLCSVECGKMEEI